MAEIPVRFVRTKGWVSKVIVWREGICMPFCATHVEWVTSRGTWMGMHGERHNGLPAGMQEREAGYDYEDVFVMPDGRRCEFIVPLEVTSAQADTFAAFMEASKGEPYDWSAPWGFLLGGHHHKKFHSMCSAKIFLGLRACGYFKWPVTIPAHELDPRDLMLILSTHVEILH